jgi:hypothetical protein
MSDNEFHQFALRSVLFKGRPDLYFCYLKSEKLAQALARLAENAPAEGEHVLVTLLRESSLLPGAIAHFAAGEFEESSILADILEILLFVRLSVIRGKLLENHGTILVKEYENIAQKVALGKNVSPFLSLEDLSIPSLSLSLAKESASHSRTFSPGDSKGQIKGHDKGQMSDRNAASEARMGHILKTISQKGRASIKDISKVIKGCSEKTIQRDLNTLIRKGFIRKEGERRWSVYLPL